MKVRWEYARIGQPFWNDKTVAIIGGGASTKGVDLGSLKGKVHGLAVKGTVWDHPWCELGFGLDSIDLSRWWKKLNTAEMPVYWAVGHQWVEPTKVYFPHHLKLLRRESKTGLSNNPEVIYSGGSSGYGALNLAYLKGAKRVVLFGYDYCAVGGNWHANSEPYSPFHVYNPDKWKEWAACFDDVVPELRSAKVEVINASPVSIIKTFPKVSVEEGLRICQM